MKTRTAPRTATRAAAVGLCAATMVLTTSSAQAWPSHRPAPEPAGVSRPVQARLTATVLQLLDDGRQATTLVQRRLTHHELIQSVLDGE